jgi:NAD(P)-dependent dehydrogenase (short-subunit alcohol dehydrogenase family)
MDLMEGKTVIVTGATSGIGHETALALAVYGAKVVMTFRDQHRGEETLAHVKAISGSTRCRMMHCDLASLDSVRDFCRRFKEKHDELHVLINNAGVWEPDRLESKDGIEMTFAVDYLSQFLMANLLLDMLRDGAPARIISTTSGLHTGSIDFEDIEFRSRKYSAWKAYRQAKLAQILFTRLLAEKLEGTGVTVNTFNPGMTQTDFARKSNRLMRGMFKYMAKPAEAGADTLVWLAASPEPKDITGEYFEKRHVKKTTKRSYDMDAARRLWDLSARMVKL